jgi:hypothetical protein
MHKTHKAGHPLGFQGECSLCLVRKVVYVVHELPIDYEEIGRIVYPVIKEWLDLKVAAAEARNQAALDATKENT